MFTKTSSANHPGKSKAVMAGWEQKGCCSPTPEGRQPARRPAAQACCRLGCETWVHCNRGPQGQRHDGKGRRRAGLNRGMLEVGIGGILRKLAHKGAEAGARPVEVPTSKVKPSQTCPLCLRQEKKLLSQRVHQCPCGCEMPRDQAAALVMLRWALDPWEPGGGEGLTGPVELRNPDHAAIAVGRG
ncbi:zinc ribbon domain-containing protein [Thermus sp.]|uniref:zinc ribbon domain-containing protein n=1 Tax=Thermus sp. TaxID=275 RepID=UPI003426EE9F